MNKNNFCIIANEALIYEDSITISQSTIYKDSRSKVNKNIKKLKESFFNKDFKYQNISFLSKMKNDSKYIKNYFINKNFLKIYTCLQTVDIGFININNIIYNKKCHFTAIYNEVNIYDNKNEYIKKYYKYNESLKIIPKREVYFRHLMQFLERPFFRNFLNNTIIKQIGLEKLRIYRRTNYPKKMNKNMDLNAKICNNNIIFNSNVIETIENCSTSMTQYSKRNSQNIKENSLKYEIKNKNNVEQNASIISEIKVNNYTNKNNDNNISSFDNSLLIIMKDLSIRENIINAYLCKYNTNYKKLYCKIKNKAKINEITNKNILNDRSKIEEKEFKSKKDVKNINNENKKMIQIKKLNNFNFYKKLFVNKKNINNAENDKYENEICHNSVSSHKKINNIRIIPFNSNNLNSQINNKNSCFNSNKFCLSSISKNNPVKILNLKKKFYANKIINKQDDQNFHKYFNSNSSKEKNNNQNVLNFLNNNKIIRNLNNKDLLKKIKKIVDIKEPKNKSMKKNIKTQKLLIDSFMCMLDFNSLNENETKKKYQTINVVKSISISNNQFFNQKSEFKKNDCK